MEIFEIGYEGVNQAEIIGALTVADVRTALGFQRTCWQPAFGKRGSIF
jgi:hypothetical protein